MNKKLFLLPLAALLLTGCNGNAQPGQSKEDKTSDDSQTPAVVAQFERISAPENNLEVVLGIHKPENQFKDDTGAVAFTGGYIYFNGTAGNKEGKNPWYFNCVNGTQVEGEIDEELEAKVGKIKLEAQEDNLWKLLVGEKYIGMYKSGTHYSLTLGEDGAMSTQTVDAYTFDFSWDATNECFSAQVGEGEDEKTCYIGSTGTYWTVSAFYGTSGQFGHFYKKK